MNTRNTTDDEMRTLKHFEHWHAFTVDKNHQVKVYGMQVFDPKTNIAKYTAKQSCRNFETIGKIESKFTSYAESLETLKWSRLEALETYENVMKEPFDPLNSKDIILICKSTL